MTRVKLHFEQVGLSDVVIDSLISRPVTLGFGDKRVVGTVRDAWTSQYNDADCGVDVEITDDEIERALMVSVSSQLFGGASFSLHGERVHVDDVESARAAAVEPLYADALDPVRTDG